MDYSHSPVLIYVVSILGVMFGVLFGLGALMFFGKGRRVRDRPTESDAESGADPDAGPGTGPKDARPKDTRPGDIGEDPPG
jgi:hypothetical protein